jgi:ubiquinone/menaquinone biosynthesis C-methylase UbiE
MDFGYANCLGLQKFLKKIGKYSKVTIVCGDARKIFLADNSIDSISSWHGLDEPNIEKALEESMRILKKSGRIALAGLLYDKGSESLKLAKKAGIQFAEKDKAYNYIKKIGFRNIKYKEFSRMKEKTNQNYIPKRGDYSTSYVIFAIK